MEKELWFIVASIICFIIGRYYEHRKKRIQCVNCGRHNTFLGASGYGGEGGVCQHAVKHWEAHTCKDCGKSTSIKMTLIK